MDHKSNYVLDLLRLLRQLLDEYSRLLMAMPIHDTQTH